MRLVSAIIYSFRARDLRQKYFITRIPARRAVQDKWSEPRTRKNIFKIRESFLKIIRSSCPQQHEQQRRLHQRLICRLSFSRTYKFLRATNRVTKILEKSIPIFPKGATAVFTFKILIFFKKSSIKSQKLGYFWKTFCLQEPTKIAKSCHTVGPPTNFSLSARQRHRNEMRLIPPTKTSRKNLDIKNC